MNRSLFLSIVCGLASCGSLAAMPVTSIPLPGGYLDVQYSVGSGPETAYFVVDFGGKPGGGPVYAFGYNYSGNETAANGLAAIEVGGLGVVTTDFGSPGQPNLFIDTLSYLTQTDTPNFNVDGRFWNYFLGTYSSQSVSWTPSNYGISGTDFSGNVVQYLVNGSFVGFYASATGITPGLPVTAGAAVPEPASAVLALWAGLIAMAAVRRSQRPATG